MICDYKLCSPLFIKCTEWIERMILIFFNQTGLHLTPLIIHPIPNPIGR